MDRLTLPLIAAATGIAGSAWASGVIAYMSLAGIPTVQAFPQTSARMWSIMFHRGKAIMPPCAVLISLSYGYAAYEARSRGGPWREFAVAAGLVVCIVPFTLLFFSGTNNLLLAAAVKEGAVKEVAGQEVAAVGRLLAKWSSLNVVRSLFPLAGAVVGFVGLLSNVR